MSPRKGLRQSREGRRLVELRVGTSDEALVAGLANGDREAAAAFVRRFQKRVYGLALSIVGDAGTAEDVAQEAPHPRLAPRRRLRRSSRPRAHLAPHDHAERRDRRRQAPSRPADGSRAPRHTAPARGERRLDGGGRRARGARAAARRPWPSCLWSSSGRSCWRRTSVARRARSDSWRACRSGPPRPASAPL